MSEVIAEDGEVVGIGDIGYSTAGTVLSGTEKEGARSGQAVVYFIGQRYLGSARTAIDLQICRTKSCVNIIKEQGKGTAAQCGGLKYDLANKESTDFIFKCLGV